MSETQHLIDLTTLLERHPYVPKSRSGRQKWRRDYDFPEATYLTPNCPLWSEDEIQQWIATRPKGLAAMRKTYECNR